MGACGEREDVQAFRSTSAAYASAAAQYTSTKYNQTTEYLGPQWEKAKHDYAPQIDNAKVNYDIARMYANGWTNEAVVDTTRTKFITEFEKMLPLRNISLNEYERRLKKLVTPKMQDKASVRMVTECFKDHWAFLDIEEENSLTRELMFDQLFLVQEEDGERSDGEEDADISTRQVHIPILMLLGVLYCRSNRLERAEKFYELVEIELTDSLPASDPEFRDYIPYLYEIPYKLMFRLYDRHRDQTPGENGPGSELQPEVDILSFIPNDLEIDDQIKKKIGRAHV